jgi:hypothetical protein
MAKKPKGIVDDIIVLGAKTAKKTIQGVRTNKKAVKKTLRENYPVSKREVNKAIKRQTAKNASSLYAANPRKFKTSSEYFDAGERMSRQALSRVSGDKKMAQKIRGDKAASIKRSGATSYKRQLSNAAHNKKKSAIEINR